MPNTSRRRPPTRRWVVGGVVGIVLLGIVVLRGNTAAPRRVLWIRSRSKRSSSSSSRRPATPTPPQQPVAAAAPRTPVAAEAAAGAEEPVWRRDLGWDVAPAAGTCRATKFQPYRWGCPITCCEVRPGSPDEDRQQEYFRVTLNWELGEVEVRNVSRLDDMSDEQLADRVPTMLPHFYRTLAHAGADLATKLRPRGFGVKGSDKRVKVHRTMHLAIATFCCLAAEEADKVAAALGAWAASSAASYAAAADSASLARFDRLECWRESRAAVSTIWVLDDRAQRRLLAAHRAARDYVSQHAGVGDVLALVTREDQMPFHLALASYSVKHSPTTTAASTAASSKKRSSKSTKKPARKSAPSMPASDTGPAAAQSIAADDVTAIAGLVAEVNAAHAALPTGARETLIKGHPGPFAVVKKSCHSNCL